MTKTKKEIEILFDSGGYRLYVLGEDKGLFESLASLIMWLAGPYIEDNPKLREFSPRDNQNFVDKVAKNLEDYSTKELIEATILKSVDLYKNFNALFSNQKASYSLLVIEHIQEEIKKRLLFSKF